MSYDDREAAKILKKAAELQAAASGSGAETRLSVEDLKRIASEVGIAPEMVEEATRRVGTSKRRGKLAAERTITIDRELGEREYEEIVGILRSEYGVTGTPSTLGSAYEWTGGEVSTVHLSMVPRDGRTTITLTTRQDGIVVAWIVAFAMNFLGVLIPLAIGFKRGEPLLGALIALAITLFLVGGTTLLTRNGARRADRQLDEVMDRIANSVARPLTPKSTSALSVLEEPTTLDQQA